MVQEGDRKSKLSSAMLLHFASYVFTDSPNLCGRGGLLLMAKILHKLHRYLLYLHVFTIGLIYVVYSCIQKVFIHPN